MTLTLSAPAAIADVLDLYDATMPIKPIDFKAAVYQHARSESMIWYLRGRPIAAAMLFPLKAERHQAVHGRLEQQPERLVELAFVCARDLAPHMLAFLRSVHLTRDRLAKDGVRVRAHVRAGHLPGQRMARILGMRLMLVGTDHRFERWEFEAWPPLPKASRR